MGYDVRLSSGLDEHSYNVYMQALASGETPQAYCDRMAERFLTSWNALGIASDDIVRTTEPRHRQAVQTLVGQLKEAGDLYEGTYNGWYCDSCEAFYLEKDLIDGNCPVHGTRSSWLEERNYFFRLSTYRDRLLAHIEAHPEFIQPAVRRNEVVAFLESGLQDISASRSTAEWGDPFPDDPTHVVYVWIDALINYITSVGYGNDDALFARYWPADLHIIGKDITRFHCVIWPAMLLSAGLELPCAIFGHGFINYTGQKLSKSLGHAIDPNSLAETYGADPIRYFLCREVSFGQDGDYSEERLRNRYNADLANDLGNLASRVLAMTHRYLDGRVPTPRADTELRRLAREVRDGFVERMDVPALQGGLEAAWRLVRRANQVVEARAPWALARDAGQRASLEATIGELWAALADIAVLIQPFMPQKGAELWATLRAPGSVAEKRIREVGEAPWAPADGRVGETLSLFPRLVEPAPEGVAPRVAKEPEVAVNEVSIEDFSKVDLRVATVTRAERVEGTDRLLRLEVNLDDQTRQLVAGIAQHYTPEELVGRRIVVIANLQPAKIRGIESQGMLLAADDGEDIVIISPDRAVRSGTQVK